MFYSNYLLKNKISLLNNKEFHLNNNNKLNEKINKNINIKIYPIYLDISNLYNIFPYLDTFFIKKIKNIQVFQKKIFFLIL